MHVTDLPLNKALGMQLAPASSPHKIEMPESPLHLNHVGTIHASAQFALAEAASGEFLLAQLGEAQAEVFAVLRTAEVKFRKPANGALRAIPRFTRGDNSVLPELAARGRVIASISVEVSDAQGVMTMSGEYSWYIQRITER